MRVAFINLVKVNLEGDSLENRGVGGADTSLVYMSRLLVKKGFKVFVFSRCERPGCYQGVEYFNVLLSGPEVLKSLNVDVLVVNRNVSVLKDVDWEGLGLKKVILWGQDMASDSIWDGISEVMGKIDKVLVLSEWHKQDLMKVRGVPEGKIYVTRNGVNMSMFKERVEKVRGKCIFSSTPYRGLSVLLGLWPEIKKRVPDATLHVFSSMKTYGEGFDDKHYEHLYKIARSMEGVVYHGSVRQDELVKHLLESEVMLYPNTFDETSCIVAMMAQAAGCVVITSARAALNETVIGGFKIEGSPFSDSYRETFVDRAVRLLEDDVLRADLSQTGLLQDWSWDSIADDWIKKLLEVK